MNINGALISFVLWKKWLCVVNDLVIFRDIVVHTVIKHDQILVCINKSIRQKFDRSFETFSDRKFASSGVFSFYSQVGTIVVMGFFCVLFHHLAIIICWLFYNSLNVFINYLRYRVSTVNTDLCSVHILPWVSPHAASLF